MIIKHKHSEFMNRQPHAVVDPLSRRPKARKIELLLGLEGRSDIDSMLEVGTGSGGIANYFGRYSRRPFHVKAVDVCDNRTVKDGYDFEIVEDVLLPFQDNAFDVVISNHVIEHVGNRSAQQKHLFELRRVLADHGVGYLAVPNRWMLVEPHYRVIFLSWLPSRWRTPYLKMLRKGHYYDCEPLQMGELEVMLQKAKFKYANICVEALRLTMEIEHPGSMLGAFIQRLPDRALFAVRSIFPTLVYRLEP
jgi:SAM-dependent methyltransferase